MIFNILVVDDSATARAFMSKSLRVAHIPVAKLYQAEHGLGALDILCENAIDLVLADMHMPVMDGLTLVRKMRADPSLAGIPVVMVTSEGCRERVAELERAGIQAYLRKPTSPMRLAAVTAEALGVNQGRQYAN